MMVSLNTRTSSPKFSSVNGLNNSPSSASAEDSPHPDASEKQSRQKHHRGPRRRIVTACMHCRIRKTKVSLLVRSHAPRVNGNK